MIYVAFDTETTGLAPGSRMVEIAGIRFDERGLLETFHTLVNPGMPIPPDAIKTHGITDEMVADAPDAGEALTRFFGWLGEHRSMVGHYAQYDTGIVSWDAARCGVVLPDGLTVIDTCEIAKAVGATKRNGLDALVEHYGIERRGTAHRAMSDADACWQYFNIVRDLQPLSPLPWAHAGHDYHYTAEFPDGLAALPELVATGAPLTFCYEDKGGAATERTITPYSWCGKDTDEGVELLYFDGYCHLRQAPRQFRGDRVKALVAA